MSKFKYTRKRDRRRLRALLYAQQLGLCYICGKKMHYSGGKDRDLNHYATFDHIIPKSKGGFTTKANLALACYICNHSKGNN